MFTLFSDLVRESQSGEETAHRRRARRNKYGDIVYDDE